MIRRRRRETPSIFDHLKAHVPRHGPGLTEGGETLPDESDDNMWAPGAQDGVLTHHWAGQADPGEVARVSAALVEAASRPSRKDSGAFEALYEAVREVRVISLVEDVLGGVRASGIDPEGCYQVAYRLATEGRHREPVKLGIALLGMFDAGHHRDELMTLGRHDEFTLFAAVALENREDEGAEADLWDLARNVRGWGRVHIVERLADTRDPQLRNWILREGFRNEVMDAYLAGIAAETGGLVEALASNPDDELLDAACGILSALADEHGPMQGMPGYPEGEQATALFLAHMATRARELRHFLAIHTLRAYAEGQWPDLAARCTEILDRPLWADVARQDLGSRDSGTFFEAVRVCEILGVPSLRELLNRLRTVDRFDAAAWSGAVRQAGSGEIDEVVALACDLLPLAEIASGPDGEMGLGPRFAPHSCLDSLLQELGTWPGRGVPLVLAGLASPVVRNRNMAVRALDGWGRDAWPAGAREAVVTALAREPDEDVRGRLRALLEGRPIE
jgi:hypothetical protein